MGSLTEPKIPVVDFTKADLKPGTEAWLSTSRQVCRALEEYGCFIIECNDVSLDIYDKIFDAVKELYDLPKEIKMKNKSEFPFRGYVSRENFYESLNIEDAASLECTKKFTNLMWPDGNARFWENAHKIASIMGKLNEMVIRMVFESYGVEKYYDSHVGSIDYLLRFSKYKEAKDRMALPTHADNSFSTILYQNHVNGLEVQLKDEKWTVYDPPHVHPSSILQPKLSRHGATTEFILVYIASSWTTTVKDIRWHYLHSRKMRYESRMSLWMMNTL